MTTIDQIDAGALLDINTVASLFGVTTRTIAKWEDAGTLPKPIRLGDRVRRWRGADILAIVNPEAAA